MMFDEILLIAVLVMLIASSLMGLSIQLAMRRSRQALEALVKQIGGLGLVTLKLDEKIESLERRVKELENERT